MSFWGKLKDRITGTTPNPIRRKLEEVNIHIVNDERLRERIDQIELLHEIAEAPIDREYNIEESLDKTGEIKTTKLVLSPPLKSLSATEKVEKLRWKLRIVDKLMRKTSIPYGRGGTEKWYSMAMRGWEKLYAVALQIIAHTYNYIEETEMYKRVVVDANPELKKGFEQLTQVLNANIISNGGQILQQIQQVQNSVPAFSPISKEDLVRKLEGFLIVEILRYALWITDLSYYERDVTPMPGIIVQQMGMQESPRWMLSQMGESEK